MTNSRDRHHIVPRSKNGSNSPQNIVSIDTAFHRAFHKVFRNMTTVEQIHKTIEINDTALTDEFKEDLR
jgi:hypothetical protein